MKALIKENCFASGIPLSIGDVADLSENDAKQLAAQGMATLDKEKIAAGEAALKAAAKKSKKDDGAPAPV